MEDIIGYIIIFGLGFGVIGLYFFRKDKQKILPVSEQLYSDLKLSIGIIKEKNKVSKIWFQVDLRNPKVRISGFFAELIDKKGDKTEIDLNPMLKNFSDNPPDSSSHKVILDFVQFKDEIQKINFPLKKFRFFIVSENGKKYKSHELGLHNWWNLMKLDSGHYN